MKQPVQIDPSEMQLTNGRLSEHRDFLRNVRRHLHRHPEVAFQEEDTSRFIRATLEEQGLTVRGPVAETGLIVDIEGSRPGETVAYRADIDAAWKKTGLPHFPPSWEKDGTHWGNTETLWPTEIFQRSDPRVAALSQHVRQDFAGGFIEGTIQWKGRGNVEAIHPYMGAYTTMTDLVRGQHEQVVEGRIGHFAVDLHEPPERLLHSCFGFRPQTPGEVGARASEQMEDANVIG